MHAAKKITTTTHIATNGGLSKPIEPPMLISSKTQKKHITNHGGMSAKTIKKLILTASTYRDQKKHI